MCVYIYIYVQIIGLHKSLRRLPVTHPSVKGCQSGFAGGFMGLTAQGLDISGVSAASVHPSSGQVEAVHLRISLAARLSMWPSICPFAYLPTKIAQVSLLNQSPDSSARQRTQIREPNPHKTAWALVLDLHGQARN